MNWYVIRITRYVCAGFFYSYRIFQGSKPGNVTTNILYRYHYICNTLAKVKSQKLLVLQCKREHCTLEDTIKILKFYHFNAIYSLCFQKEKEKKSSHIHKRDLYKWNSIRLVIKRSSSLGSHNKRGNLKPSKFGSIWKFSIHLWMARLV